MLRVDDSRTAATAELEVALADIFRAGRRWTKTRAAQFTPELSPMAFGVLRYVVTEGPIHSTDIVSVFGMDKGSVSRQVAALRDLDLVTLTSDPDDRRATLIASTQKAADAFAGFRDEARQQYDRILADWATDDLHRFAELLRRFYTSFD